MVVAAESHKHHSMVHFVAIFGTVQVFLGHYALGIRLQHPSRVDCHANWLNQQLLSDLIVGHFVMLYHVSVFEMEVCSLFAVLSMRGIAVGILALEHDTVLLRVFVSFVHPSSIALEVLVIAIHELLDGVLLNLRVKPLYLSKRFQSSRC